MIHRRVVQLHTGGEEFIRFIFRQRLRHKSNCLDEFRYLSWLKYWGITRVDKRARRAHKQKISTNVKENIQGDLRLNFSFCLADLVHRSKPRRPKFRKNTETLWEVKIETGCMRQQKVGLTLKCSSLRCLSMTVEQEFKLFNELSNSDKHLVLNYL